MLEAQNFLVQSIQDIFIFVVKSLENHIILVYRRFYNVIMPIFS